MKDAPAIARLLGISGSLRQGSYCKAIMRTIGEQLGDAALLPIFDIGELPHYNQDQDGDRSPQVVRDFRDAIVHADAVLIVSPEYNYGIPGVLKNAIDWASRPAFNSVLKDKDVLFMTASPAFTGGARAQAQIREVLLSTLARVVPGPEVVIGAVHEKVAQGRLTDDAAVRFIMDAVARLLDAVRGTSRPLAA